MMFGKHLVITFAVLFPMICAETILHQTILSVVSQCKEGTQDCSPYERGQYALCSSCSAFVVCGPTADQNSVVSCPEGLLFDTVFGFCHQQDPITTGCRQSPSSNAAEVTTRAGTTADGESNASPASLNRPIREAAGTLSKIPGCLDVCNDTPLGVYPSCAGCQYYLVCGFDLPDSQELNRCPGASLWDNSARKCLPVSSTCAPL